MTVEDVTEASQLYGLPLGDFTAARDALARQLQAEGNGEGAKTVSKLRKPSIAAWALNQTARHHPDLVQELLDSHQRLRKAGSKEVVEQASQQRSRAVSALTEAAISELEEEGRSRSGATRDRINRTLLAVATDTQGEADLVTGTLVREIEPSGAGWGEMTLPPAPELSRGKAAGKAATEARARAEKQETIAVEAERRVESAKQTLAEARRRARQARAAADRASRDALAAEEETRRTEV